MFEYKTRDEIIEGLTENKRQDLEDAMEDAIEAQLVNYEIDLDNMSDVELAKEYEQALGTKVEIE